MSLYKWIGVTVAIALAGAPASAQPASRAPTPTPKLTLTKVASFKHQVTGVAVSKNGRIFVNFPRWSEDTAVSVAELKDGALVPFPDAEWNAWRNANKDQVSAKDHWVCVQSVVADAQGNVWVLDPAAPAEGMIVPGGPKLVEIDLKSNKPGRSIPFSEAVAPKGSYLNDVRFSPDGKTAFVTDSGAQGALVVVDLTTGKARRVLDGDPSTQSDKTVTVTADGKPLRRPDGRGIEFAADGIALSPDGATLYWQAIRGKTLYSIPTAALASGSDAGLAAKVETVGENGPADGLLIGQHDGRMYVSSPQDNSIKVRDLGAKGAKPSVLITDSRLRWPDTFAEGPDGTMYITTSHIRTPRHTSRGAPIALPTELWSWKPAK